MFEWVLNNPAVMAAIVGSIVGVLFSIYKKVRPNASSEESAKAKNAITGLVLAIVTAGLTTLATKGDWNSFGIAFLTAWSGAQTVRAAGKTASYLVQGVAKVGKSAEK